MTCLILCVCVCVVQADADSIDALEKYRGKCEPTFLFYGVCMFVCVDDDSAYTVSAIGCEGFAVNNVDKRL